MFLTRARPISLSADELGADPAAAQQPQRDPIDVDAWVRFPETPVRVCGRAVAWTDRAVCVEFTMKDRATHRAWVWASAVDRRSAR
ncbi:hypothetical protein [Microbacterium ulmi]|uniref:Uncharacterized protein n=2 Tax=Microbacterium ulmi TaxID=179095 RepID=A0A7Y2M0K4_9MICO|nr:hypothetical protein [Microbacterium ulmi]NNH03579.1 hypothetical protein [Microbacterium ulmi]